MNKPILVLVPALLVSSAFSARAATKTWDGSANGNWSVGANWSGGTAPAAGDDLVFPTSAAARRNTTNNFILGAGRFGSIEFRGNGYVIHGALIALSTGIRAVRDDGGLPFGLSGTNTINAPLELRASQSYETFVSDVVSWVSLLEINGAVELGAHTLTIINFDHRASVHLNGAISGTGGIVKSGSGTFRLGGLFANTYTGSTTIDGGTVELNKGFFGSATAIAGDIVVGSSVGSSATNTLRLLDDDQIANGSEVTVNASGLIDLNGYNDTLGPLTLNGGEVTTGIGLLTLGGNMTATSTSGETPVITGNLSLGAGTKTFTILQGPEYVDLTITARISGTPGFRKAGEGHLLLNGNNTYLGATTVQEGILAIATDNALGSTANGAIVTTGASLILFGARVNSEALILNGSGWSAEVGALHSGTFSNSWGGPITLLNDSVIGTEPTSPLNLLGVISGPGGLTKIGEGTLIYSGGASNTYTGATRVHEGTLLLKRATPGELISLDYSIRGELFIGDGAGGASSDVVRIEGAAQINNSSTVTIFASGLLDVEFFSEAIGSLTGFGRVNLRDNELVVGANGASTSYGGQVLGTFALTKVGTGNLTLTGDSPFSGALEVYGGALIVNGSQPRSDVIVNAGTLGGHGTVGHIVAGNVSPGSSPGILSCSNVLFTSGGTCYVELNGPNPGTDYDQLNARGNVTLLNTALHVSRGFPVAVNQQFIILANDGTDAINGTFNGLAEGATFPAGGLLFRITYTGGTGNDVALTRVSAPASTITALASLSNGDKQLEGLGGPDLIYTIEGTTNLNSPIPWIIVGEAQANGAGVFEFLDTNAALYPRRFYRAQSP